MSRASKKPLAPPTMLDRAAAADAARALRKVLDGGPWGEPQTAFLTLAAPRRRLCMETWANLPGFSRQNGTYCHVLLPGWGYTRSELAAEMVPDLETLAERGVRPTEATR